MSFTNFVLGLFNNTGSGYHKAYRAAAIGAKGVKSNPTVAT